METQAVVFPEANKFDVVELELDTPGADDMVVRTLVSAISPGTERWILRGKHIGTKFPCVPGYQRIGIVEECGKNVKNFQTGEIVYGCGNRWKNDIISMWGAHAGASVSRWDGYTLLASAKPAQFELETTVFAIVAGVGVRGIRFLDVRNGQKLCIIGAGFIGLCAAQLAMYLGADPVMVETDPERAAFAKTFIPAVVSPDDDMDKHLKEFAPAGLDLLYDTVGHAATTDRLVKSVRSQGTMLLQAQYFDKERCAIDIDQFKVKEITVKTTCGIGQDDFFNTVDYIRKRIIRIGPMITHRFNARDILKGYEILHTNKPFNMGIVFDWK